MSESRLVLVRGRLRAGAELQHAARLKASQGIQGD